MTDFLKCILYLAAVGMASYFIGLILPRRIFRDDRFPFRPFRWEKGGAIYEKLGIRKWKGKMPDMSRIVKSMTPKRVKGKANIDELEGLIAEASVAEMTHDVLIVLGIPCLLFWRGIGGIVITVLWTLSNLMFVMIQRYNRPRFRAVCNRALAMNARHEAREQTKKEVS